MDSAVYTLCAVTSALCAMSLLRAWRSSRAPLLLWSGLAFVGLTSNNLLLVVDFVVVPTADLALYRSLTAAVSILVLLGALIWTTK